MGGTVNPRKLNHGTLGHDKLISCFLDPAGLILVISKKKRRGIVTNTALPGVRVCWLAAQHHVIELLIDPVSFLNNFMELHKCR